MKMVLVSGHVIHKFLIVLFIHSAHTRLLHKVDTLKDDLLNYTDGENKQKSVNTPIPPSGFLSNSTISGDEIKNKFTNKEVNVTCADTELCDNKIDTDEIKYVPEVKVKTDEPLILKPSLKDNNPNEYNQTANIINENDVGTTEKALKIVLPTSIPSNGLPSNNSTFEGGAFKNEFINNEVSGDTDTVLSDNKVDEEETSSYLLKIKDENEKPLNLTPSIAEDHKEERHTTDAVNDKDDKTTEAVYIDLTTPIPPSVVLKPFVVNNEVIENKHKDIHTYIRSRLFPGGVGRDHILPLATILTYFSRFLHIHQHKDMNEECIDTELSDNNIDTEDTKKCKEEFPENVLKLTPFINEGGIDAARNACRVDSNLFLGIESYSGYFTVNETYDSNIFFWYFPVEKKPLNETPLIIWLQGGPGASSMTGLFDEIGPFTFIAPNNLTKNPNTWLRHHSLLFIDNPVGTGFSFTMNPNGFATDMETYGDHLYSTVQQFMRVFPELRAAPLFVAGESYAGKYVPALAMRIHRHKADPWGDINLQGMILGNAYVDPVMLHHLPQTYYNIGLVDKQQIKSLKPFLDRFKSEIEAKESVAAKNDWNTIIYLLLDMTHQQHGYNFLRDDLGVGAFIKFLKKPEVKRAIHVGDIDFHFINITVNLKLAPEFLSSAKHMYEELLNEYRVLFYCGQLDLMMPCTVMTEQSRSWRWSEYEEFQTAMRYPYMFHGKLAGYHKTGGRLTEVVIRGAGHMVPVDRPEPLAELVASWTLQLPLPKPISMFWRSFVDQKARNDTNTEVAMPYL